MIPWGAVYCWCNHHQHAQATGSPLKQLLLPFQSRDDARFAKRCCCCWVWSTQRCPAHTQCLSWWAGSGLPRRSASDRLHIWSTPGGKLCPERASSSQTLWSSSRRKRRDRPGQTAWGRHQHEYREEEKLHRTPSLMSGITHQPEVVSPTQLSSQLVVKAAPHLPESAATQVAAQAVLVPVLLNGLQEEPVADALLAAATGEQRWRHLQDLVHRLPVQRLVRKANLGQQFSQVQSVIKSAAEQIKPLVLDTELVLNLWPAQKCIF